MLQNEFVPVQPTRNLPGSSNLSLLTGASQFDPALIEKGELHVTEDDKAFARLIGDWLMYISIRTWGKALLRCTECSRAI